MFVLCVWRRMPISHLAVRDHNFLLFRFVSFSNIFLKKKLIKLLLRWGFLILILSMQEKPPCFHFIFICFSFTIYLFGRSDKKHPCFLNIQIWFTLNFFAFHNMNAFYFVLWILYEECWKLVGFVEHFNEINAQLQSGEMFVSSIGGSFIWFAIRPILIQFIHFW